MHTSAQDFRNIRKFSGELVFYSLERMQEINTRRSYNKESTEENNEAEAREVKKYADMVKSMANLLLRMDKHEARQDTKQEEELSAIEEEVQTKKRVKVTKPRYWEVDETPYETQEEIQHARDIHYKKLTDFFTRHDFNNFPYGVIINEDGTHRSIQEEERELWERKS